MDSVDYAGQFFIIDDLLIHVHRHSSLKYVIVLHDIRTHNLRNRRTPKIICHISQKDSLYK